MVGRRFDIPTDEELFDIAERGQANLAELRQSIQRWNKGSAWLELTEEQYRRLRKAQQRRIG